MSKSGNFVFRSTDEATLNRVLSEYLDYAGREAKRTGANEITIYALPQSTRKKREEAEAKLKRLSKRQRMTDDNVRT